MRAHLGIVALLFVLLAASPGGESPSREETQSSPSGTSEAASSEPVQPEKEEEAMEDEVFYISVGDAVFAASYADNSGAQGLRELLAGGPVSLSLRDYGGFEKVGGLGQSLPTSDRQTTAQPGDVMLYQGNQIVLFYGSNSWSYTPLGTVDDLTGWAQALGRRDVEVTLSAAGE